MAAIIGDFHSDFVRFLVIQYEYFRKVFASFNKKRRKILLEITGISIEWVVLTLKKSAYDSAIFLSAHTTTTQKGLAPGM